MGKTIIIPDRDFAFVAQTFTLAIQHTQDGERLTREQEQARRDRELAAEAQLAMPLNLETKT